MGSDFKRMRKNVRQELLGYQRPRHLDAPDALFEHDWEELVIRFDRIRRTFTVRTIKERGDEALESRSRDS